MSFKKEVGVVESEGRRSVGKGGGGGGGGGRGVALINTGGIGTAGAGRVEFNEGTGAMGNVNGFVDGNVSGSFTAAAVG